MKKLKHRIMKKEKLPKFKYKRLRFKPRHVTVNLTNIFANPEAKPISELGNVQPFTIETKKRKVKLKKVKH